MNLTKEKKMRLIKSTFLNFMEIKRENGTILFFFKFLDKKDKKLVYIREKILFSIEKNLECLNFIFLNINKINSSIMVDCMIGIDTLTGVTSHLNRRLSLSLEYLITEEILIFQKMRQINNNIEIKDIFSEMTVGHNSDKINYYCFNNKESLEVIWTLQELICVRKLAVFSGIRTVSLPFIKEQNNFDTNSFINLINCFLIKNNLVVKDGFILKKDTNNIWKSICGMDYIMKNIRSIFRQLKKEYPGQLYELNINDVVLKMARPVFYEIYKYPHLLIAPEDIIPTHITDRLLLEGP